MPDVNRILSEIEHGDPSAADQLLPLVDNELRKLLDKQMMKIVFATDLQIVQGLETRQSDAPTLRPWCKTKLSC
ncbi:ECF-type sigma factor [Stieleria maiorica]|nr:ECF-type sigma factor [Stieleria maiorica]